MTLGHHHHMNKGDRQQCMRARRCRQRRRCGDGTQEGNQVSCSIPVCQAILQFTALLTPPSVLPATLFGHILDPAHGLPPSISLLDSLHDSRNTEFPPPYAVDVEDAALLHVAAIMISDVKDQRIFAASPQYKAQSMIQLLRALDPRQGIWSSLQHNNRDAAVLLEVDKAEELLRRLGREGWTDWQGSVGGS